jgi:hypothetical protein
MGGRVARLRKKRNAYQVLDKRKRALGRPRCRWENNIKLDFQMKGLKVWTGSICLKKGTICSHL